MLFSAVNCNQPRYKDGNSKRNKEVLVKRDPLIYSSGRVTPTPATPTDGSPMVSSAKPMIDPPETIESPTREVFCDGGPGALGHPRVYYVIGDQNFVECGYCDRRFVLKAGAGKTSHH